MLAPGKLPIYRADHLLIAEMVVKGSRVLDVGCGDGSLLQLLADTKAVDGRGIEVERERVNACVARGLSVIQGDADSDLADYPDDAFDYAILSLTIQATLRPKEVLEQLLRIGRYAIVSFPNFGHWQVRTRLLFSGRMPVTENLPEAWYVTPNVHLCTIKDFGELCEAVGARVERAVAFNASGRKLGTWVPLTAHNLLGEKAVFMLTRRWADSLSPRAKAGSDPSRRAWAQISNVVARGLTPFPGGPQPCAMPERCAQPVVRRSSSTVAA